MARTCGAFNLLLVFVCVVHSSGRTALQTAGSGSGSGSEVGATPGPVSSSSCSSAGASATTGAASAWAKSSSKAITATGSACANAFATSMSSICDGGNAYASVVAAAESCATAMTKIYISAAANTKATGDASACGNSCSNAQAVASAVAKSMADAYAKAEGQCSQVSAYLRSQTFVQAVARTYGTAWASACSKKSPSRVSLASAEARAVITTSAVALAKAFGDVAFRTCACSACRCSAEVQKDAQSMSETSSIVVGGKYALATGVADAGAVACKARKEGKKVVEYSQAAASIYLEAFADTCLKLYGSYYLNVHSGKWSSACAGVDIKGQAYTQTLSKVVAEAWAMNFDGSCSDVYSYVQASVLVKNSVDVVARIVKQGCSAGGQGNKAEYDNIKVLIKGHKPFADAAATAFGEVFNRCPCELPFKCCSTCDWAKTCPGYMKA